MFDAICLPAGERNDFRLEELFEPLHAAFAPLTTLAIAAERPARMNEHAEVDRDRAGADAARERKRAVLVLRPNAARQSVDRVVRDANGVLVVVVRDHRKDGTEDLFLR